MKQLKKWMPAAILFCGAMLGTSCQGFIDAVVGTEDKPATTPATPTTTLPKTYNLVADEYKEALLDPLLELNYALIEQDQSTRKSSLTRCWNLSMR